MENHLLKLCRLYNYQQIQYEHEGKNCVAFVKKIGLYDYHILTSMIECGRSFEANLFLFEQEHFVVDVVADTSYNIRGKGKNAHSKVIRNILGYIRYERTLKLSDILKEVYTETKQAN